MKKIPFLISFLLIVQIASAQWNTIGWNPYLLRDMTGDSTFVLSSPSRIAVQNGVANWVPGGGASGIDDVLAEGQALTANRTINLNGYSFTIQPSTGSAIINLISGEDATYPNVQLYGFTWTIGGEVTKIEGNNTGITISGIPTYADDAAAGTGGVPTNGLYKTSSGQLMIKLP
jgi:hypothetical protein